MLSTHNRPPFILSAVKRPHTHLCCVIAIACDHIASPWVQQSYQLWPQLGALSIAPSMAPSPYYPSCHTTPTVVMDLAVWIPECSASFFIVYNFQWKQIENVPAVLKIKLEREKHVQCSRRHANWGNASVHVCEKNHFSILPPIQCIHFDRARISV